MKIIKSIVEKIVLPCFERIPLRSYYHITISLYPHFPCIYTFTDIMKIYKTIKPAFVLGLQNIIPFTQNCYNTYGDYYALEKEDSNGNRL